MMKTLQRPTRIPRLVVRRPWDERSFAAGALCMLFLILLLILLVGCAFIARVDATAARFARSASEATVKTEDLRRERRRDVLR